MSPVTSEPAAWLHVQAFVAASGTPRRADELYGLLSPAAMIVLDGEVDTAEAVGKERFLATFRHLANQPQVSWGPRFTAQRLLACREEGDDSLIWAEISEDQSQVTVTAAFLLDTVTGHMFGACLSDDQSLTAAALRARILAEFAHWSPEAPTTIAMMSGLALSFDRQFSADTVRLLALP
jgi:hypothetical protein